MTLLVDDLNISRGLLGTAEDPPGSNHNFITDWYADRIGNDGFRRAPWCAMSRSYTFDHAGGDLTYAYCPYIEADAKAGRNGLTWLGDTIEVGAWVLFDFRGGGEATHVGHVESLFPDGTFYSLEGNIADAYRREHRDMKYVRGFVRVPYDGEAPAPVPDPGPGSPPTQVGRVVLPTIQRGSRGRAVKFAQSLTNADGGPDGFFWNMTAAAVSRFQRDFLAPRGVRVTGVVDLRTWSAMLQAGLNWVTAVGGNPANLDVDGIYGPATTGVVIEFQRGSAIDVDGIASYQTFGALTGQ